MTAGPALEMWSQQSGSASTDGVNFTVTMQRGFTVLLDAADPLEEVYNSSGLPLINSLYPGTYAIFCTKVTPTRTSPIMATVLVEYEGEAGQGAFVGTPIDQQYSLSWRTSVEDAEIDEDWDGNPIANNNGEPVTGIHEKLYDDVLIISKNFLTINRYALRAYRRAVNSDVFFGWPPGTARIIDDEADAVIIDGNIAYWKVKVSIQFREPYRTSASKAWWKRVRHEGFTVRITATDPPTPAWDEVKGYPSQPVLLKQDGTEETNSAAAYWKEFQTLGYLPFSALGLTI